MEKGLSGGVSLIGTLSALSASLFFAALYYLYSFDFKGSAVIILSSFIGCVIDSIMGVLLQAKYECGVCGRKTEKTVHCNGETRLIGGVKFIDNCMVNLLSNIISVILAIVLI